MHKTLERQLNKLKNRFSDPSDLLQEFTQLVDQTYSGFDKEQKLKDRAIHLMAEELEEAMRKNQQRNEAFTKAILDTIVDGVVTVSVGGEILSLNMAAASIVGLNTDNLKGKLLTDLIQEYDHFSQLLEDLYWNDDRRQVISIQKDFSKVTCAASLSYFDLFQQPVYILIIRDISKQQEAENRIKKLNDELKRNVHQLEVSNKDLESFSYSVSHDLRTPIGFVRNFASMLKERMGQQIDEKSNSLMDMIQRHLGRMEYLIDDLLEFSRSGKKELEMDTVEVDRVVRKTLQNVSEETLSTRILIKELYPAYCDGSLIYQVFSNLIGNALKYSSKVQDPTVEVGSEKNETEVVYYIKDNGAGFDEKQASRMFEPFQRLHSNEDFKGTGVGLAIARRIVTRHGGRIWASGRKNEGATFHFSLPNGPLESRLCDKYVSKTNFSMHRDIF